MKTILKSIVTISVILCAFFFSGCEKDLYDESIYQHHQVTQEKISFNELMAVIKDPTIKSYLSTIRQDISTGLGDSKLSDEELLYFQKFVKENAYTSYSLRLNDFSPEKPYYLDLVIKTDGTTEKAGFIKYISDETVPVFDARSFTGRIEVSNLKDHVVANNLVVGGVAVNASGSAAASECFSTIELVQHNCTHGENHAPGEACNGPGGNDGYYEIIITNICLTYPEDLNFIAAPDASMGSNTGSGGPESSALNSAYNFFTSNFLNEYQGAVLAANPKLKDYLMANNLSEESKAFALELINLALAEPNQVDANKILNVVMLVENSGDNFFTDEFELSLDPYVDIDLASMQANHFPGYFSMQYYLNYKRLRQVNPEWSRAKCAYEATSDVIHLSLDVFGLVPLIGEPADLINGVLYTIEGDGVNATLSYASALPIVGYGSSVTKFSLRFVNSVQTASTISTRVKLVWKVTSNGIQFGDRAQLRKVLGLAIGDLRQAHHLIPWEFCNNPLVQKAAKSNEAFHMNEALNGIPLPTTTHLAGHNLYNQKIQQKLVYLNTVSPTPEIAFQNLNNLIGNIRTLIQNNPNMSLGQIANLIN